MVLRNHSSGGSIARHIGYVSPPSLPYEVFQVFSVVMQSSRRVMLAIGLFNVLVFLTLRWQLTFSDDVQR